MKLFGAHGGAVTLALAVLAAPGAVQAQTCNTQPNRCAGAIPCPSVSSPAPNAIWHATQSPCGPPGPEIAGFNFIGTEFANTCQSGAAGCQVRLPPLRYWLYDSYKTSNSGCVNHAVVASMQNSQLDVAWGTTGHWFLYQGNWANGPLGDGFPPGTAVNPRTVVEFSWPDTPSEGSVNHKSWYMVASVPVNNDYNFDNIKGGTGCTVGAIAPVAVPSITIPGHAGACTGNATATLFDPNAADANFFDVPVVLATPNPEYYDEVGKSTVAVPLISGYQILYHGGTTNNSTSEPTSSALANGWQVARSPANPGVNQAAIIPTLTATQTMVSLPSTLCSGNGCWFWLATRIIYKDASLNGTLTAQAPGSGPWAASEVSSHCGPVAVRAGAVSYDRVTAERTIDGIRISWKTFSEDDTLGFQIVRATGPSGTENVETLTTPTEARGAYYPYEVLDTGARDVNTTYWYYVEELTSAGPGDVSERVSVAAVPEPEISTTGGRTRTKLRR